MRTKLLFFAGAAILATAAIGGTATAAPAPATDPTHQVRAGDVLVDRFENHAGYVGNLHVDVDNVTKVAQPGGIEITLPQYIKVERPGCTTLDGVIDGKLRHRCPAGTIQPGARQSFDVRLVVHPDDAHKNSWAQGNVGAPVPNAKAGDGFRVNFPRKTDLAVSATETRGKVGDTVTTSITVANKGGAKQNGFRLEAVLPKGTTSASPEWKVKPGVVFVDSPVELQPGKSTTIALRLKIVGTTTPGTVGVASVGDTNPANNTARLVVHTGDAPALPLTGTSTAMVAGTTGAAALGLGITLVALTRRRRTT